MSQVSGCGAATHREVSQRRAWMFGKEVTTHTVKVTPSRQTDFSV